MDKNTKRFIKLFERSMFSDFGLSPEDSYNLEISPVFDALGGIKRAKSLLWENNLSLIPKGEVLIIGDSFAPLSSTLLPLYYALHAGCRVTVILPTDTPGCFSAICDYIKNRFREKYVSIAEDFNEGDFDFIYRPSPLPNIALIHEDCDYLLAVNRIAFSKYLASGQNRMATDFCLIPADLAELFVSLFSEEIEDQLGTDPLISEYCSPMISKDAYEKALSTLETSRIVFGGAKCEKTHQLGPALVFKKKLPKEPAPKSPALTLIPYKTVPKSIKANNLYVFSDDTNFISDTINKASYNSLSLGNARPNVISPLKGICTFATLKTVF